jgi:hypothetical protein
MPLAVGPRKRRLPWLLTAGRPDRKPLREQSDMEDGQEGSMHV